MYMKEGMLEATYFKLLVALGSMRSRSSLFQCEENSLLTRQIILNLQRTPTLCRLTGKVKGVREAI